MLQRMKRGYTREAYDALVQRARDVIPNVALSTDMITGTVCQLFCLFCPLAHWIEVTSCVLNADNSVGSVWLHRLLLCASIGCYHNHNRRLPFQHDVQGFVVRPRRSTRPA
jgi:hypothetical protein